jgi:hypothetical protein
MFHESKRENGCSASGAKGARTTTRIDRGRESIEGVQKDREKELGSEDQPQILPQRDIAAMFSDTPTKSEDNNKTLSAL